MDVNLAQVYAPDLVLWSLLILNGQLEPLPEELHGELIFKSLESPADTSAVAGLMASRFCLGHWQYQSSIRMKAVFHYRILLWEIYKLLMESRYAT